MFNTFHSSKNELNLEILNAVDLLETFISITGVPRSILEQVIPILDQSDYILTIANSS